MYRLILFLLLLVTQLKTASASEIEEHLYWDSHPTAPKLTSRTYSNQKGEVLFCMTYDYDELGRIAKETLQGDLTGQSNISPGEQNCPSCAITYCYLDSSNDKRYISQQMATDAGCTTLTTFNPLELPEIIVKKDINGTLLSKQEMQYDSFGNKISETHLNGTSDSYIVAYKYGPDHRLEEVIEAPGSSQQRRTVYQYDPQGQLTLIIKPDGITLSHEYDSAGRILSLMSSDHTIGYRYTYGNQTLQIEDIVHNTFMRRSYNAANQMIDETQANGLVLANTFDSQGRRTHLTLPDRSVIEYVYDTEHLKEIRRLSSSKNIEYTYRYTQYDEHGNLISVQLIRPAGEIIFKYDTKQRLMGMFSFYCSESIPSDGYDENQNLTKINISDCRGSDLIQYAYDNAQNLISEKSKGFSHTYTYDSIGNRLSKDQELYINDQLNRLVKAGETYFSYDLNGCLIEKTSKEQTIKFQYDALNRLISIQTPEKICVKYTYDAFGRCMSKTVSEWEKSSQQWVVKDDLRFLYDGNDEIGIVAGNGNINALRVLGLGKGAEVGAAVALELNKEIFVPIHDRYGSVCCLIDLHTPDMPLEYICYSAFGEISYFTGTGIPILNSQLGNPWSYCSKRFEEESGLVCFGKRFYDPSIGRWITPDPLGFIDGPNRYCFVHNNPIAWQDHYGLFSLSDAWNSFTTSFTQMVDSLHTSAKQAATFLHDKLSYSRYIRPHINQWAQKICGKTFLSMLGFFDDRPETGTYGKGELSDKVRITAINGILNLRNDIMETIQDLSSTHGNVNIHYVFYPTQGWGQDLLKATAIKLGHVSYQAEQLAETWKRLIHEMGGIEGGGLIIHYAHSIGGTNTYHAKSFLTPEEQRMIRVITVGSPTIIPSDGFESVRNYVSCRDGVTLFDPVGLINGLSAETSNVIYLGTFFGIPIIDHLLTSSTYKRLIEILGQEFLEALSAER